MNKVKFLICILFFSLSIHHITYAQTKRVKKAIKKSLDKAIDNGQKSDRFYLAKFSKNKLVVYDELKEYCGKDFILHEVKFHKTIGYGEMKKMVITRFKFRKTDEAIREESALLKKILATEKL